MSHETCFTVRVECWGRFDWSAHIKDTRLGTSLQTMRMRTPQECLRDIADQLDRACVNEIFKPQPKETL